MEIDECPKIPYSPWFLLEIAESAKPPEEYWGDGGSDHVFCARDGWLVSISYDVGELDYINHFITPDGDKIDFWEWPESDGKTLLINWRGIGDLKRLLKSRGLNEITSRSGTA